jgi:hypothetical protein
MLLRLRARLGVGDELADAYPAPIAGTRVAALTTLGDADAHGQDVLAVLPAVREVRAVAGLLAVIYLVAALPGAARHLEQVCGDLADLVAAGAVELEGPVFAGIGAGACLR